MDCEFTFMSGVVDKCLGCIVLPDAGFEVGAQVDDWLLVTLKS